jgi:signal transduction histidine kinase/FixJ family two-component response regulator
MEEKILLVDDEEGIRKVLGISLIDSGYQVFTAENGAEALKIISTEKPSLVLSDIKMPVMDGLTLLRKIRSDFPETEVIMITAHGDMNSAIQSLKLNAADFITKPIDPEILDISLKRAFEKISMRRRLKEYTENLEALVKEKSERLIEVERLAAVGQAVEGISLALQDIAGNMEGGIKYFNEMPCFVAVHNKFLKVVATNDLYKKRLGNMVGRDSWHIYPDCRQTPPLESPEICPVAITFRSGKGQRCHRNIEYLDGSILPVMVHTAPIRNSDGNLDLVLEISADMSEIKRLQEKLRTTEQRYQQLFDQAPCYITVQDKSLKLQAVNKRFQDDFGDGKGVCCFEAYKHQTEPCEHCPVIKTFEDGKSHQSEMVVTSRSNEKIHVLITTAALRDSFGEISMVMEMSTNITKIRELQDHLSSLGFLISSISHGIKGLLTGLDGGMYLVDSGFSKENEKQVKEGWEVVKLMVERIRNMVLDILYYAKDRELRWERVNILCFAEELAFMIEPKIAGKNIEFIKHFSNSVGEFEIDPGVVRSALINILENAVEACLEDKTKKKHQITFEVCEEGQQIRFDVWDNGVGMDNETCDKIFTLFFSLKGHMGTGLGLFISNKIIHQHGGEIIVKSAPSEGSHFIVRMPKQRPLKDTVS